MKLRSGTVRQTVLFFAESTCNDRPESRQVGPYGGIASSAPRSRTNDISHASVPPTPEATRKILLDAAHNRNYESAIAYGRQLADGNSAGPDDLLIVAQSYSSVGDCGNACLWSRKTQDAYQAAGVVPDSSLRRVILCCGPGLDNYELAIVSIERGLKKRGLRAPQ